MVESKRTQDVVQMESISAVGGLWFDTAIAKLRFSSGCCQQVAGCCQRVSVADRLTIRELAETLEKQG
jgi:hypothetical protein